MTSLSTRFLGQPSEMKPTLVIVGSYAEAQRNHFSMERLTALGGDGVDGIRLVAQDDKAILGEAR